MAAVRRQRADPLDDRPWIAAHGDGHVYYLGNAVAGGMMTHRLTVHRSTDGGETFDPIGFSFRNSWWGFIDADPSSPYVYVFMDELSTPYLVAWVSPDRGETWTRHVVGRVTPANSASNLGFPTVAVSPKDGTVYVAFDDNDHLYLGESKDRGRTWSVHDVTPFAGAFAYPWISVSPQGDVGFIFEADPEAVGGGAYVYGMIWRPTADCLMRVGEASSMCTGPSRIYGRLQPESVPGQGDFVQVEMMPDGRLAAPWRSHEKHIRFTIQESGPNLDGNPTCGLVGTP